MTATCAMLEGRRCVICGASWWLDHPSGAECSHCRLVVRNASILAAIPADLARRLVSRSLCFAVESAPWFTDDAGARNLAWRFGYTVRTRSGTPITPSQRGADVVAAPAIMRSHGVTLGMIARADDDDAPRLMAAMAPFFERRVVILDAPFATPFRALYPGVEVAAHPLAGDFAAQRNRLQAIAGDGWVLQVDSDETPDGDLLGALGWLTAEADRDGLASLGLPRRNLVDGALSALYPDIQYRLNRSHVRFANRVHERPVVAFAQSSLALVGALDHRLSAARVRERSRVYEGMEAGAGRLDDERLLLEPFDPIAL